MSYARQWPHKTPSEVYRNGADWSALLDGATIASVSASLVAGDVTIDAPDPSWFDGAVQYVWVSGGSQVRQKVRCHVVLSDGREYDQDFDFKVW